MSSNPWQKMGGHTDHYESALRAALDDLDHARREAAIARSRLREADRRVSDLTILVRHLSGVLPSDKQAEFSDRLSEVSGGTQNNRTTPVYDNVVELFRRERKELTVAEVNTALATFGVGADPKTVYNVLNYLERKGRLRRVAKGQYVWVDSGIGIQVDEDLSGADQNGRLPMDD